eukprot:TRINITY_DN31024_c0_g1_i1.p1 TRINITY_DN31024_c0_g1~~TRINITY_DN31024_c0_g1_i1.p1  ORF type:complete len:226 (+),score=36.11 TRINITY_DN31024_c0_g1_i1:66-743(+)
MLGALSFGRRSRAGVLRRLVAGSSWPRARHTASGFQFPFDVPQPPLASLRTEGVGESLVSFEPKQAAVTWVLSKSEIVTSNSMYPLESLWVHQGKLRCRLIAHAQGSYVKVHLRPSCEAGYDIKGLELQASLSLFGAGAEPLTVAVCEQDWFHKGIVADMTELSESVRVELRLRRFVALLRRDESHFDAARGRECLGLELVPMLSQLPVDGNLDFAGAPQLLIEA